MEPPRPAADLADVRRRLRAALPDLRARYGVASLAVFGSFARGEQTDASDVDLLVELDEPLGFAFMALADDLETLLGRSVDLGQAKYVKAAIRARVIAEAVSLDA